MGETSVHRALADERRARIVEELGGARDGLDAVELGRRVGLHPNTVRFHLGVLADAGVVTSRPAARRTPGRPRILYSLEPDAVGASSDEYRLLATILAGTVSADADGPARAAEAGRAWGRYLVERPQPLVRVSDEQVTETVVDLLDRQGFAPDAAEGEIRMHRCPFHALAETHPEVVCSVHRGLIAGALEELGSDLEVGELEIFARPDLCVAHLRRSQPAA
jgi:predicted ArsR family transcriptional regulator